MVNTKLENICETNNAKHPLRALEVEWELDEMVAIGHATKTQDGVYSLTERGRQFAEDIETMSARHPEFLKTKGHKLDDICSEIEEMMASAFETIQLLSDNKDLFYDLEMQAEQLREQLKRATSSRKGGHSDQSHNE